MGLCQNVVFFCYFFICLWSLSAPTFVSAATTAKWSALNLDQKGTRDLSLPGRGFQIQPLYGNDLQQPGRAAGTRLQAVPQFQRRITHRWHCERTNIEITADYIGLNYLWQSSPHLEGSAAFFFFSWHCEVWMFQCFGALCRTGNIHVSNKLLIFPESMMVSELRA